jgi:hypothetical protein
MFQFSNITNRLVKDRGNKAVELKPQGQEELVSPEDSFVTQDYITKNADVENLGGDSLAEAITLNNDVEARRKALAQLAAGV